MFGWAGLRNGAETNTEQAMRPSVLLATWVALAAMSVLGFAQFVPAVPLPVALPLFVTGIGGLGLLSWLRLRSCLVPPPFY